MSSTPLKLFDPRRNMHVQGFSGRGATTTLHDATATGVSISGIFQAAEDFAVLGFWNAYDYFAHLRLKHLPRTDLSGLKLEYDIEYDHTLDGAMRFDAMWANSAESRRVRAPGPALIIRTCENRGSEAELAARSWASSEAIAGGRRGDTMPVKP